MIFRGRACNRNILKARSLIRLLYAIRIVLALAFLVLFAWSCSREPELKINETIFCDLEKISSDGKYFVSDSHPDKLFQGADKKSEKEARSGKYSILLMEGGAFGLNTSISNTGADQYYRINIWRKGNTDKGFIIVGDENGKYFYKAVEEYDSVGSDGWKRLSLTFYVPPNLNSATLRTYAWNPGKDSVFFDDISITRLAPRQYPQYTGIKGMDLYVDTLNMLRLAEKRKKAFNDFILVTEDNDWVEGMLFYDDDLYRTEMRLKGDWLDHLLGAKWSFRIEVKDKMTWEGMRTFSIQNPESRDFLNEWLMHEFCRDQDILATRYGFVPVTLNSKSLGIYAWEEHFEKYLVESNNRREGPILKVNEDALWENSRLNVKYKEDIMLPVVLAAGIMPFKAGKTSHDPVLYGQYLIAQELYYQYKYARRSVSEIFDVDKLAKYVAMIDLFRTYHGITWHNQRFYYNPVISKLEPIAFDNFSEKGPVRYFSKSIIGNHYLDMKKAIDENLALGMIFRDQAFNERYIHYLELFSDEALISKFLDIRESEIHLYDSLIKMEYTGYHYDKDYILENARLIRQELPEYIEKSRHAGSLPPLVYADAEPVYGLTSHSEISEKFIQAYIEEQNDSSCTLLVENNYINEIFLLGTSRNAKAVRYFFLPEVSVAPIKGRTAGTVFVGSSPKASYLHYMVAGDRAEYTIPIYPWPRPLGKPSPLQQMQHDYGDNYLNYFTLSGSRDLIMKPGQHEIREPLIIPAGYLVHIPAGTRINLLDQATFISCSTVDIAGTEDDPVEVSSPDGSANGFCVFQAPERSKVSYTVFDRLNTLDKGGWMLTGAVTFYESDVDIYHSTFQNNLSEDGLNIIRSDFYIDNCEVINTFADALDVDFGTGTIINTTFKYLSNDAIDVSGTLVNVENCIIQESNDKGISGGENSVVHVWDTKIEGAVIGIASKDFSQVDISGCRLENCRYGLVAFQKKPEFGPASIKAAGLEMMKVGTEYLVEEGSSCIVNGEMIPDESKNVYDLFYQ